MRISDWSSDVCSSDLADIHAKPDLDKARALLREAGVDPAATTIEFVSWQDTYAQVVVQMVRKLGFQVNHVALDDLGAQNRLGQYDWNMNCMASGPRADGFLERKRTRLNSSHKMA